MATSGGSVRRDRRVKPPGVSPHARIAGFAWLGKHYLFDAVRVVGTE
jgi:hypothetical protein